MLTSVIRSKVDLLWDKFWSGGIANPLAAMEQISYLLFMRRLDELDRKRQEDAEWLERKYTSLFDGKYTAVDRTKRAKSELRWSYFRHMPAAGDEVLFHIRDNVFPFIKSLGSERGDEQPFTKHMKDAVFLVPKSSLLVEAIGIIDEIYDEIERERVENAETFHDTQGDLYEHLLAEIATSGKNGQFRTPRHIIQMMCALLDPKLGEQVCDPACGTGGFLLGAFQHIVTQHTSPELRRIDASGIERGDVGDKLTDERQWDVLHHRTFYGFDFDTTMVRIGLMNLTLHGIESPHINYADTLGKNFTEEQQYDVVLANPPFKGSIDKGDISELLELNTKKTELLFVNRIFKLLRIGGRAGVIVPDGVLFGSSKAHRELREIVVDQCELQAVVSMPAGVFKPYAGVSTAILFFVRGGRTENVWFYDMQSDGFSLDDKREPVDRNDIPDVLAQWKQRNPNKTVDRKAKAFYVPVEEIRENKYDLSINRYKEIEYEEVEYDPPLVILDKLESLEKEIAGDLKELRGMVS